MLLVTVTGTWITLTGNASAAGEDAADPHSPATAFTTEEQQTVAATQRLYQAWGLEFPNVPIRFHADSTTACDGEAGLYQVWADGRATVDVCYPGDNVEIGDIMRDRVLWHEVAHAYIEPRTDEATKAAFLDELGLQAWSDTDWDQRGGENAAEILVWGMSDGRYHLTLEDIDCETKSAGFEILTGLEGPSC